MPSGGIRGMPGVELSIRLLDSLRPAGGLEDLTLTLPSLGGLGMAALAELPLLRRLEFHASSPDQLDFDASPLTRLLSLELVSVHVSRLPNLRRLVLDGHRGPLDPLSRLGPRLTCLDLHGCALPRSLSGLRALRQLVLDAWMFGPGSNAASLDASLAQLSLLTSLALGYQEGEDDGLAELPPAVSRMACLQRCLFDPSIWPVAGCQPLSAHGSWLRSLCWLGAPPHILFASSAALAAAPTLEWVCILGMPESLDGSEAFWAWAASAPTLRRLSLEVGNEEAQEAPEALLQLLDALLLLLARRPLLVVERIGTGLTEPLRLLDALREEEEG
ncbi:hypothetical protein ABPG75_003783 [Micractinium tetrahymenae]